MKIKGLNICSFDPYDEFGLPNGTRYRQHNNPFVSFGVFLPTFQINDMSVNNGDALTTCMAQKMTGLTNGNVWNFVWINCATATGNVRVKVYQDDGSSGDPSTLLAQSSSIALVVGWNKISCSFTVPASGNVWLAYEFDTSGTKIYGTSGSCNAKYVIHTYGTGPSPFGTTNCNNTAYNMGISN